MHKVIYLKLYIHYLKNALTVKTIIENMRYLFVYPSHQISKIKQDSTCRKLEIRILEY